MTERCSWADWSDESKYGMCEPDVKCPRPATRWFDNYPGDPEVGPQPDVFGLCDEHAAEWEKAEAEAEEEE